ncbi:DTW domain-containing protein [bacterium]|nr:DTW domain-containing protein [bacterium]MBU1435534.1 DTW domain-containing protein [bacterium]MBU1502542.1 DTW domain-containing protein [bacterium]
MCEHINAIMTNTKFVILMHPKEFKKVKNNTGFFTHLSLSNSELFIGVDFSQHKRIGEILATHESYILFPSSDAINLSEQNPKRIDVSSKEVAIFILDSTWACTNKILLESTNLRELPHLSFTTQRTSQYQIKEQPQSNYLSTIESTLVVLEELHKHEIEMIKSEEFENFLNPFFEMIDYQQKLIKNTHKNTVRYRKKYFL